MSRTSTPKPTTPRASPPRFTPSPRTTPTRTTPTRTTKLSPAKSIPLTPSKIRDQGNHSMSMLGAERYKNQLHTTANSELFKEGPKVRTMYRRPSELGMSTTPMEDKSEVRRQYDVKNIGRGHIVKPIPDHEHSYHASVPDWEEDLVKDTESQSHYKDLHAKRPICNRIADTLKMEGEIEKDSEVQATYKDLHAKRPIIHKLVDHDSEIQPHLPMEETSEYRSTINKLEGMQLKGERVLPPWLGVQKITPFGTSQDVTRE
ncbi:uncharacterized protein LOC111716652 [Eurytemora carolleeae]|uniref:uncharacterized protein LOC111716652 n=1 Tax=Eurytemora carolleeae TaxID=1294199 RepID=UPI000C777234|nr:uncharacterized protein LOC111716652 [Eurytemora carolleeae]|eukprot:XP_023347904.1 uncharacterized protein LOC111716652 [Eurytemora affinis]